MPPEAPGFQIKSRVTDLQLAKTILELSWSVVALVLSHALVQQQLLPRLAAVAVLLGFTPAQEVERLGPSHKFCGRRNTSLTDSISYLAWYMV